MGNAGFCGLGDCRKRAKYLCDYPVDGKTCDMPLCEEHANKIGHELDLCPYHKTVHDEARLKNVKKGIDDGKNKNRVD